MENTYRWGILAPGKIAHKFAAGLQFVPGARLQAVGSRDLERARTFAQQYHAPRSYGTYSELAADPEVDIIYIASPHTIHMDNTLLCLEHGKAVLCEKPLAINSYQVQRMIGASNENKAFLMEALWSRFLPNIVKTRQLVEAGEIGRVSALKADFGFKANYNPGSRLFDPALGGGALLDIGIYPLFFAQFLFGKPEKIEAEAKLAATGVDESCQVWLNFTDGRTADLTFTLAEDTAVEARINGSDGQILLPNRWYQPVNVMTFKNGKPKETIVDFVGNGYNYQAVEVQRCLEQGKIESTHWSHQESLDLMQTMDEIRRLCGIEYPADKIL